MSQPYTGNISGVNRQVNHRHCCCSWRASLTAFRKRPCHARVPMRAVVLPPLPVAQIWRRRGSRHSYWPSRVSSGQYPRRGRDGRLECVAATQRSSESFAGNNRSVRAKSTQRSLRTPIQSEFNDVVISKTWSTHSPHVRHAALPVEPTAPSEPARSLSCPLCTPLPSSGMLTSLRSSLRLRVPSLGFGSPFPSFPSTGTLHSYCRPLELYSPYISRVPKKTHKS